MSAWVVETLVATTLLLAAVLLIRPAVRRAFGASAAYALWLVPALRLILPPIESVPTPVAALATPPVEIVFAAAERVGSAGGWLFVIWAIGAAGFAAWHVAAYHRFLARALVRTTPGGRGIQIAYTDAVAGPAAVGLFRRRILLPVDFSSRYERAESDLALRHERVHHARGDLWANAVALGMLSLHWFNPIAHRAYRAFREDQELSCDAAVIAAASPEDRAAYGAALVKSARGIGWATPAPPSTICPMTRTHNLKRRLKMVRTHRKSALASVGGAFAVAVLALAGLTLTATGGIAAQTAGSAQSVIIKRTASKAEADAAIGTAIQGRCGDEAQVAETKKSLRAALSASTGKPVRVVTLECGAKSRTPAQRVGSLEKAIAAVNASNHFDPEQRAKIVASLNEALAEAKAGK